ncbi:hypothetical protein CEUSTIGMA_g5654.t1 [Chlamydomonas eustigma]|uniref:USP domain-containing protein n=1 Tax=Chlamydomonas eustigma TaxID=1157962 RepID=A0A250X5P3_9CHLO|nr:hypothetical protein CEUSTIGMA_g5654.t1 [Chlamydomonas eustigma]|eukprot:GAX78212.1 hypothetical protein CEUSTIGMA_g5654.t1 [Chlamydomonas eustigma]
MKEKVKTSDSTKEGTEIKDAKGKKVTDKKNVDQKANINVKKKDAHDRIDQLHKSYGGKAEIQGALRALLNSDGFDSEKRTYAMTKHLQFERDNVLNGKAGLISSKQALSDLARLIARLCECGDAQILRSMTLIQLYVDCCANIGPGAISILTSCLSTWFHHILHKTDLSLEGWMDPKDEKAETEPEIPGKSKAERLQSRASELMDKAQRLKFRVRSCDYISKAAGFKPNAIDIAMQEHIKRNQEQEEAFAEQQRLAESQRQQQSLVAAAEVKSKVQRYLQATLGPIQSQEERINALLRILSIPLRELHNVIASFLKQKYPEDKSNEARAAKLESEIRDTLVHYKQHGQQSCLWSAVPPSQLVAMGDAAALSAAAPAMGVADWESKATKKGSQSGNQIGASRGAAGTKAGKGGKNATGNSSKSSKEGKDSSVDASLMQEGVTSQLVSLEDWLDQLVDDLEKVYASTSDSLLRDMDAEKNLPSVKQLWSGNMESWLPITLAKDEMPFLGYSAGPGENRNGCHEDVSIRIPEEVAAALEPPEKILDEYAHEILSGYLAVFKCKDLPITSEGLLIPLPVGSESIPYSVSGGFRHQLLAKGYWVLLCDRGLLRNNLLLGRSSEYTLHPVLQLCLWSIYSKDLVHDDELLKLYSSKVYSETVSILCGEGLLGTDLVLRREGGVPEAVAEACDKALAERKEMAAVCASYWSRETGEEVQPNDQEWLLKGQLVIEVLQVLKILEACGCLTTTMRRAVSGYFRACKEISRRCAPKTDPVMLQSPLELKPIKLELFSMPLQQLRLLRNFCVEILGGRAESTHTYLQEMTGFEISRVQRYPALCPKSDQMVVSLPYLEYAINTQHVQLWMSELMAAQNAYLQQCAEDNVLPPDHVPIMLKVPSLGTAHAEELLLGYLWGQKSQEMEELDASWKGHNDRSTFKELLAQLEMCAFYADRLCTVHKLAQSCIESILKGESQLSSLMMYVRSLTGQDADVIYAQRFEETQAQAQDFRATVLNILVESRKFQIQILDAQHKFYDFKKRLLEEQVKEIKSLIERARVRMRDLAAQSLKAQEESTGIAKMRSRTGDKGKKVAAEKIDTRECSTKEEEKAIVDDIKSFEEKIELCEKDLFFINMAKKKVIDAEHREHARASGEERLVQETSLLKFVMLLVEEWVMPSQRDASTVDSIDYTEVEAVLEDILKNRRKCVSHGLSHLHFMEMVVETCLVNVHGCATEMALSRPHLDAPTLRVLDVEPGLFNGVWRTWLTTRATDYDTELLTREDTEKSSKAGSKKQAAGSKGNKKSSTNTTGNSASASPAPTDSSPGKDLKRVKEAEETKAEELPSARIKIQAVIDDDSDSDALDEAVDGPKANNDAKLHQSTESSFNIQLHSHGKPLEEEEFEDSPTELTPVTERNHTFQEGVEEEWRDAPRRNAQHSQTKTHNRDSVESLWAVGDVTVTAAGELTEHQLQMQAMQRLNIRTDDEVADNIEEFMATVEIIKREQKEKLEAAENIKSRRAGSKGATAQGNGSTRHGASNRATGRAAARITGDTAQRAQGCRVEESAGTKPLSLRRGPDGLLAPVRSLPHDSPQVPQNQPREPGKQHGAGEGYGAGKQQQGHGAGEGHGAGKQQQGHGAGEGYGAGKQQQGHGAGEGTGPSEEGRRRRGRKGTTEVDSPLVPQQQQQQQHKGAQVRSQEGLGRGGGGAGNKQQQQPRQSDLNSQDLQKQGKGGQQVVNKQQLSLIQQQQQQQQQPLVPGLHVEETSSNPKQNGRGGKGNRQQPQQPSVPGMDIENSSQQKQGKGGKGIKQQHTVPGLSVEDPHKKKGQGLNSSGGGKQQKQVHGEDERIQRRDMPGAPYGSAAPVVQQRTSDVHIPGGVHTQGEWDTELERQVRELGQFQENGGNGLENDRWQQDNDRLEGHEWQQPPYNNHRAIWHQQQHVQQQHNLQQCSEDVQPPHWHQQQQQQQQRYDEGWGGSSAPSGQPGWQQQHPAAASPWDAPVGQYQHQPPFPAVQQREVPPHLIPRNVQVNNVFRGDSLQAIPQQLQGRLQGPPPHSVRDVTQQYEDVTMQEGIKVGASSHVHPTMNPHGQLTGIPIKVSTERQQVPAAFPRGMPSSAVGLMPPVLQGIMRPPFVQAASSQQQQQHFPKGQTALQVQRQQLPQQEEEEDDLGDIMNLCGVGAEAAPAAAAPAMPHQAVPVLPNNTPHMLPPHLQQMRFGPQGTGAPPMSGGVTNARPAALIPALQTAQAGLHRTSLSVAPSSSEHLSMPAAPPAYEQTLESEVRQQQQQPWTARSAGGHVNRYPQADVEPGPAGFPGVVDDEDYPSLNTAGGKQRGSGAKPSWSSIARGGKHVHSGKEDEEDEEYQKAIRESEVSYNSATTVYSGSWDDHGRMSTATSSLQVTATGLINRQGEYNCFLNVIIQCLWHNEEFRSSIAAQDVEEYRNQPVVYCLAHLFKALTAAQLSLEGGDGVVSDPVDPSDLREALDNHNFRVGEMNDPSEVLSSIYECLVKIPVLKSIRGRSKVEEIFGLELKQELRCPACHVTSHVFKRHVEYFHIVQATALRNMSLIVPGSLSYRLKELEAQNFKKCDKDVGGCDRPDTPFRQLLNQPSVFTLQMAWEEQVSADDIKDTLEVVDTEMALADLYNEVPAALQQGTSSYHLYSMFCYYGQHYHAFIYKEDICQWVMFDDAHVSPVGEWQAVIKKCTMGRIQPLVLFYKR